LFPVVQNQCRAGDLAREGADALARAIDPDRAAEIEVDPGAGAELRVAATAIVHAAARPERVDLDGVAGRFRAIT
jgi:hypothetical protein